MSFPKILIIASLFFMPHTGLSHEGHHHGAGETQPQKGGVLKTLETVHVELVQMNKEIQIFIFNKETPPKPLLTSNYPVSARVIYPRGKGEQKLELTAHENHWSTKVDDKGMHRYDFILNIEQGGHKDDLKFTVEPK